LNVNETQTIIRDQVDALGTYMTHPHKFALFSTSMVSVLTSQLHFKFARNRRMMFDHAEPVNIVIQTLRFLEKVRNHIY